MKNKPVLAIFILLGLAFAMPNVKSGSMGTEFDRLDKIEIKPIPIDDIKVGNVVCFLPINKIMELKRPIPTYNQNISKFILKKGQTNICHRVMGFNYWANGIVRGKPTNLAGEQKLMVTKGDRNRYYDEQFIDKSSYRGIVTNFIENGG